MSAELVYATIEHSRPADPERALAAAVIESAVADARAGRRALRSEYDACAFLADWRLDAWCHVVGINPERVRTELLRRRMVGCEQAGASKPGRPAPPPNAVEDRAVVSRSRPAGADLTPTHAAARQEDAAVRQGREH